LQPFGILAFSSAKKGGSQFFVDHLGGWGWLDYRPASAWLHQPPPQILKNRGKFPKNHPELPPNQARTCASATLWGDCDKFPLFMHGIGAIPRFLSILAMDPSIQ
jgi:hypothetical protein